MNQRLGILITETYVHAGMFERSRGTWQLVRAQQAETEAPATLMPDTDLAQVAEAIQRLVEDMHAASPPAHLIVPCTWCYHQRLDIASSGRSANVAADTVAYALEEYLPLPLEHMTCAYAVMDAKAVDAIAIRTAPMQALLHQLASAGIQVEHIHDDASTAFRSAANGTPSIALMAPGHMALHMENIGTDGLAGRRCLVLESGTDPTAQLVGWFSGEPSTMHCIDVGAERWLGQDSTDQSQMDGLRILHVTALEHAGNLPDFRTGDLGGHHRWQRHRKLGLQTLALANVLLLAMLIDGLVQYRNIGQALTKLGATMTTVFQEALPETEVPADPALRLTSERIRLEALSGRTQDQHARVGLAPFSAVDRLRDAIAALPPDVRMYLDDCQIDERQLTVRGRALDHKEAERIAEALGRLPDMEARPPRTSRRDDDGVDFVIRVVQSESLNAGGTLADAR